MHAQFWSVSSFVLHRAYKRLTLGDALMVQVRGNTTKAEFAPDTTQTPI